MAAASFLSDHAPLSEMEELLRVKVSFLSRVKLSEKLGKLLSGEAFLSAWQHASRRVRPVSVKEILAKIDSKAWSHLRQRYPFEGPGPFINRFADVEYWIKTSLERAQDLQLDRCAPMRIIDLGCGGGYFAFVCRYFGHECVGLDVDTQPLFRELTEMLGIPRIVFRIEPNAPLPDFGQRFDLVTAFRVCFHKVADANNGKWRFWRPEEWKFFLHDLRSRVVEPGGRVVLDFNPQADGTFYSDAVKEFFRSENATFFRSRVFFGPSPTRLSEHLKSIGPEVVLAGSC